MSMMASEIRICFRLYFPWQEEKKMKWLEEMAREGWHLTSVCGIRYEFIKGNPHKLACWQLDNCKKKRPSGGTHEQG